ncbi:hypothetical protein ACLB2K_008094 [Fragaria x ananassa]
MFWPTSSARGDEGTNVKMVCAGRATSRMRKENGTRPDFLTRRMRAPASPDEEIFPSLLFLITCRSILTVRASRATIGKSETSPDGLRDLKRGALRTLGFREDSKVSTVGSAVLHFACTSTEDVITRDLAPNAQFEFEFRYNPVATDWNCYMGYNITQGQLRAGGFHAWSSGNIPKYGGVHAIWSIRDSGFWLFHIKSGQYTLENSWRTSVAVSPV